MALAGEEPKGGIFRAIQRWAQQAYLFCNNEAKLNINGRVLHVRSGDLWNSLDRIGRYFDDGFKIGTNLPYGIGWELGMKQRKIVPRPGRIGRNNRPAALQFMIGGQLLYRRSVTWGPYAPRPFLKPAIENNIPKVIGLLDKEVMEAVGKIFPGGTLNA